MAGSGGGGGGLGDRDDDPLSVGSYSQLLLSEDVSVDDFNGENCFNFASSFPSDQNAPKMLCFGDECDLFFEGAATKVTCSDSSSATSTTTINAAASTTDNATALTRSNKKKNMSVAGAGVVKNTETVGNSGLDTNGNGAPAVAVKQRNGKRTKVTKPAADENSTPTTTRHAKAKKEKLGERIIALQQLVSPFGKTDTASVLHEAMGYIKFLQDQVQVLCSPYLQRLPSSAHLLLEKKEKEEEEGDQSRKDLRSKGLRLVPIELTLHVAETNGADFWSPAMVNNNLKLPSNPQ